jgi:hypothetical protein
MTALDAVIFFSLKALRAAMGCADWFFTRVSVVHGRSTAGEKHQALAAEMENRAHRKDEPKLG